MSHDHSNFADTVGNRPDTLLRSFREGWAASAFGPVDLQDIGDKMTRICSDFYATLLLVRLDACVRYYYNADGDEARRRRELKEDLLFYSGFVPFETFTQYPSYRRPICTDHVLWAHDRAGFPDVEEFEVMEPWVTSVDYQYLNKVGGDVNLHLGEATNLYYNAVESTSARESTSALAAYVHWFYLAHYLHLVVWRSDENVAAMRALEVRRDEVSQEDLNGVDPRDPTPYAVQAVTNSFLLGLQRQRYRALEQTHPGLTALRRYVFEREPVVAGRLRAMRISRPNCRRCRNQDMIDAVTHERIPAHRCWQAPNGVCWNLDALRTWYDVNNDNELPDRSGPLPVHIFRQQDMMF